MNSDVFQVNSCFQDNNLVFKLIMFLTHVSKFTIAGWNFNWILEFWIIPDKLSLESLARQVLIISEVSLVVDSWILIRSEIEFRIKGLAKSDYPAAGLSDAYLNERPYQQTNPEFKSEIELSIDECTKMNSIHSASKDNTKYSIENG